MRVVQINSVCGYGSTGKIVAGISDIFSKNNVENYVLYTLGHSSRENAIKCGNYLYTAFNALKSHLMGNYGFNSFLSTKCIIKNLKKIKPDKIILHNIHSHDCNLAMLFEYIKRNNIDTYWVFHDCWGFTGYCTHFDNIGCQKWQTECNDCEQYKSYSYFFDKSKKLFRRKKNAYSSQESLTVIAPSKWLGELVKKSFLKDKRVVVINNGIDLASFKVTKSDFRERYNLQNKKIVLGIPKGNLKYFLELRKLLNEEYCIVLVGLGGKEISGLPENMIGLPYTQSKAELAKLYSMADIFANTTLEDTFPTVNIEALACGTPVVTFNTGGSPEILDEKTGWVVEKKNVNAMADVIMQMHKDEATEKACVSRANSLYNEKDRFQDYYELLKGSYYENSDY